MCTFPVHIAFFILRLLWAVLPLPLRRCFASFKGRASTTRPPRHRTLQTQSYAYAIPFPFTLPVRILKIRRSASIYRVRRTPASTGCPRHLPYRLSRPTDIQSPDMEPRPAVQAGIGGFAFILLYDSVCSRVCFRRRIRRPYPCFLLMSASLGFQHARGRFL